MEEINDSLSESTVNFLNFIRKHGGYWFGHLKGIREGIVAVEDWVNNKGRPCSNLRKKITRAIHLTTGNTVYYLDYENGSDDGTGADWANAWKTITSGASAGRIGPGDIIRIAKSSDPTSLGINATWTNQSRIVTLASALTANIDLCEETWTASADVTCSVTTSQKEGSFCSKQVIASGFTTGLVSYKALGEAKDFSSYQQVSFWVKSSSGSVSAGTYSLRLCSDTVGVTTVDTISIPYIGLANGWHVFTVDTGGALGASIQSIALYAESDPGTPSFYLDAIIACKASSADDSLSLTSLLSKNSSAQGGEGGWHGIRSINGTTVELDTYPSTTAGSGETYSGTTETVATYKRETIKTQPDTSNYNEVQVISDQGSEGNLIEFQGGYDTSTTSQDGETFFDGTNGCAVGLECSRSYVLINHLSFVRYYYGFRMKSTHDSVVSFSDLNNNTYGGFHLYGSYNITIPFVSNLLFNRYGFYLESTSYNNTITTIGNVNSNSIGVYFRYSYNNIITTISNANNNSDNGIELYNSNSNHIGTISNANNNVAAGLDLYLSHNNDIGTISNANNNAYGVASGISANTRIGSISTTGNSTSAINSSFGEIYLNNALIGEETEVTGLVDWANGKVIFSRYNQTEGDNKIITDGGEIVSQDTVRHTASGLAWQLSPTSTNRQESYPLSLSIAKIACEADALVTVKAWMRKDNASGIVGKLVCQGGQITGVASDVTATKSDVADTWEELEITFTPTEAGVVEIEAWAYGGTTYNLYVDDMTITQA